MIFNIFLIKSNKSPGYDNIHVNVMRNLYNEWKTFKIFLNIFKKIFPDGMKVAKVTPIFKKVKNLAFEIIDQYLFFLVFQKSWNE